ncbi:MAG: hypothetical protein AB8B96_00870 [Lysobacterales bacterium]
MIGLNLALQAPLALSLALAGSGPLPIQECSTVKLTPPLADGQEVVGYSVVPDSSDRVAYLSDIMEDSVFQLYTVPADGSAPGIFFDVGLPEGRAVRGFPAISPLGVGVFRADFDTDNVIELYSISTADGGGVPLKLNGTLVTGGDVQPEVVLTPNGASVVYLAEELSTREELYIVPITGGDSRRLNAGDEPGDIEEDFQLTPDGSAVVYRTDNENFREQLYVAPLSGGDPILLSADLTTSGSVDSFQISADGTTVVYAADRDTRGTDELFRVPITGGTPEKINGPELERSVDGYAISADSQFVVYTAPSFDGATFRIELYSATLDGGSPIRLNNDLPVQGFINRFVITADSAQVIYIGSQETAQLNEVYRVPTSGGMPIKLSGNLAGTDGARGFFLSPDNQLVVTLADLNPNSSVQVLSFTVTPLAGGAPQPLAGPFIENGGVNDIVLSPDSRRIIFSGDLVTEDQTEIFSANLSATGTVQKLSGDLPMGGSVGRFGNDDFQISAGGDRLIYLADQDRVDVKEVYSSELNCDGVFSNGFE